MTNADDFVAQSEIQGAQRQLTDAYLNPETPEQTAKRFQKARAFELPPWQAEAVTPEEEAAKRAASIDWVKTYAEAPVMMERLNDPAFANLVKDDLANVSAMESLVWHMAPEKGQKETVWGAVRNAFTQGGFAGISTMPLFGSQSQLEQLSNELQKIEGIEQDIAAGKDVSARFATAEEPTGQLGLKAFLADKDRVKGDIIRRMSQEAEQIARLQRMQAYFPAPEEVQRFMEADGLGESLARFADSPMTILASTGVSSFTQMAPGLLALAVLGPAGLPAQAGAMYAFSFGLDRNASMQQNLQEELGIDLTDSKQLVDALTDPTKREAVAKAADRANMHALGTAAFDAASVGLAGKVLLPKSITQRLAGSVYKKELANLGVQGVVQGAMGGAGEASGQLLSDGEISSWSDVVAEILGEQFTAPVEVLTTGMHARHQAQQAELKAQANAQAAQQLGQTVANSSVNAMDPETMAEHIDNVAKASGVETVSIDAQAFHQHGLDRRFGDVPEIASQLEQARETGGDIVIPMSVYAQKVQPKDPEGLVASIASFAGLPSVTEAQEQAQATNVAIASQTFDAAMVTDSNFRKDLADVGREVGKSIRQAGATRKEAKALQAIIQTHVANLAQSLGVSPKAVWQTYGARILGEPRVQRDAQGNLVSVDGVAVEDAEGFGMGSPLWKGDLPSFVKNKKQFGRFQQELAVPKATSAFWGKDRKSVRLQITKNQIAHIKKSHPDITDEQLGSVPEFLDKSVGGYIQPDGRVVLFKSAGEKKYLLGVFEVSESERRVRENEAKLQMNLYNVYEVDENTFKSQIKKRQIKAGLVKQDGGNVENISKFVGSIDDALTSGKKTEATEHPVLGGELPAFAPTSHGYNRVASGNADAQNEVAASGVAEESEPSSLPSAYSSSLPQGDYFPLLHLIARWRNADRSTLLHETAHLFLDMRARALADLLQSGTELNENQAAFRANMQEVFDWLGFKDLNAWESASTEAKRKAQEKFARSFEAYVMEGRAPIESLKDAFKAFASWLKNVYHVIANIPDAELTNDVRAMFDAMFSADESVREAMLRQGEQTFFMSAQQGGMTQAEWDAYRQAHGRMISDAKAEQAARYAREEQAVNRLRRRAMKELKGEAKGKLAEIRKAVQKRVRRTKTYRAWDTLKNGKSYEGEDFKVKLFEGDLKLLGYNQKQINLLYNAGLATKRASLQPIPIAQIAEDFGYANANELVDDMLKFRDMPRAIDEMVAQQFIAENPALASESRMRDLADAAIFNDAKAAVVATELSALERMGRQQAKDWRLVYEELAREEVSRQAVSDCKPINSVRLANRAARNARKAFLAGNIEAAITFKRQELYHTCVAKEAKNAMMELAKGQRKFSSYRKTEIKAMDTRFLTVIQRALANMGFYSERQLSLNPEGRESFSQELDKLTDETGAAFDAEIDLIQAINAHDPSYTMTVGGFRNFIDLLDQLDAQGRKQKQVSTVEGKVELEQIQTEVSAEINQVAEAKGRDVTVRFEETGRWAQVKDMLRRIGINHFRAATICGVLDGDWGGKLTKLLIFTSDRANNREETLRNKYTEKLAKVFEPIRDVLADNHRKTSRVTGTAWTTHEVFVMLLNMGNEGNRQRLISTIKKRTKGKVDLMAGYDLSDPTQKALADARADQFFAALFAEYLDERHYKAAQDIWNVFSEIQQETDKVARSINGRSPVWVQARPVTVQTADGPMQLTGGYYPIRYDRRLNLDAGDVAALEAAKTAKPIFANSGVSDGHLKSRVNVYDHALTLTARAMFEGLDDQIHYIAWAQWVRDANKVLDKKGAIANAIAERYGSEWRNALRDWVKSCRDGNSGQTTSTDALADLLRRNVSLAGIGFNVVTAALQFTGYAQSLAYLGVKWSSRGMADFLRLGGRARAQAWVEGKSVMMRSRIRTQFRELAEVQARITGNRGTLMDRLSHAAYLPITYVQSYVDLPTWLGAYEKALYEGKSETEAIAEADRAVINTQGSGRLSDLSAYERGNAWQKLMTVFYTFFNAVLQNAIYAGMVKNKLGAAKDMLILLALQPVLESFMRSGANELFGLSGDGEDDDEKMKRFLKEAGLNAVEYNLGLFVGLRELSYLTGDFGYSGPAGLRKIGDTGKGVLAVKRILSGEEVDDSEIRAIVSALGVWAGIPVTPINRAISGAAALERGDTDNPLVMLSGYSQR